MRLEKKYYAESHIKLEVNEKNCIVFGEDNIYLGECLYKGSDMLLRS